MKSVVRRRGRAVYRNVTTLIKYKNTCCDELCIDVDVLT